MNIHHSICTCYSPEHTVRWMSDPDEETIYMEVYLNQYRGFFKRLWTAFKYVFGYRSRYGHWDVCELNGSEMKKLLGYCEAHLKRVDEKELAKKIE